MSTPSGSGGKDAPPIKPGRPGVGSGDPSTSTSQVPLTADAPTDTASLTGAAPPASRVNAATNAASSSSSSASRLPSSSAAPSTSSMPRPQSASVGPGANRPTVSMVPGRGTGAALRAQPRMTFKPVMPQRRKVPAAGDVQIKQENVASTSAGSSSRSASGSGRGSGERGRGFGRGGRGGPGGGRGGRRDIELVASGPFSLGTGSTSRLDRARQSAAGRSGGAGAGMGASGKWGTGGEGNLDDSEKLKPDPGRMAYRNPDKLRDKEEYSDPEEDIEIVDLDDVGTLDELAPRALPRVQEKEKKRSKQGEEAADKKKGKGKGKVKMEDAMDVDKVKPDPEDEEQREKNALSGPASRAATISSGTSTPRHGTEDADSASEEAEEDRKGIDALDLSESEAEEIGDDLVDDFVFDEEEGDPTRLYLFQFPQLFPKFTAPKVKPEGPPKEEGAAGGVGAGVVKVPSALSSSPPGSSGNKPKRSVAFAEGTSGGTPPASGSGSGSAKAAAPNGVKKEPSSSAPPTAAPPGAQVKVKQEEGIDGHLGPEGMIGRLQVYKDGRVEMHFGKIVMEVSGGSQTTFLQDLALLDASTRRATLLGEVHRKFTVSPNVENMLDDMAEEEARVARVKKEGGDPGAAMGSSDSEGEI
ncbi:hypothetical protein BCV69DRAFT_283176 [Microstroma glucosiphilum]|uniref:RNA polymerase III RPC4-domain-containing protein n=1 Tax=Pseudomicrostroma glucosiphilum TaxID=1684307 RepID=A0A316U782_9BASI|nr:hypothetical protein BCV69DRAFT_283176 [Pseudomicrostroma glucosiphilum]PWN20301.1 hypothetical protein BCV69DRAFT_283176 [Pseudomicrostroma glucosiphilum]